MKRDVQRELEGMEAYHLLANKQEKESFLVPVNYFKEKQKSLIEIASKNGQFQVPESYFEQLPDRLLQQIDSLEQNQPSTQPKIIPLQPWMVAAASIALFALSFFVFQNLQQSPQESAYSELFEEETFDEIDIAFFTDDRLSVEAYLFDELYQEYDGVSEDTETLDPLFEDLEQEVDFDALFSVEEL